MTKDDESNDLSSLKFKLGVAKSLFWQEVKAARAWSVNIAKKSTNPWEPGWHSG